MSRPRVLYVDAYDSFANNIVGLLESALDVSVTIVQIDDACVGCDLESFLIGFAAVVVGPGPGDPRKHEDVGFINQLWKITDSSLVPVLGICLGFQSLALAFGGSIKRLQRPRHGLITEVSHQGRDIFEGVEEKFEATQYHSFQAVLDGVDSTVQLGGLHAVESSPALEPLAWDQTDPQNGPVLQAIRHKDKPFWGLQYHPESIGTAPAGAKVVCGWWKKSLEWLSSHNRAPATPEFGSSQQTLPQTLPKNLILDSGVDHGDGLKLEQVLEFLINWLEELRKFESVSLPLEQLSIIRLCEGLDLSGKELILLDSQQTKGRFSIIGVVIPHQTLKLTFTIQNRLLTVSLSRNKCIEITFNCITSIWTLLQRLLELNVPGIGNETRTPFCGGLMGSISYEASLDTIGVSTHSQSPGVRVPDFNFAFIERSVVIDHIDNHIFIQSMKPRDNAWLSKTAKVISCMVQTDWSVKTYPPPSLALTHQVLPTPTESRFYNKTDRRKILEYFQGGEIQRPLERQYCKKILSCQEALQAGDSYELCLTDQTTVTIQQDKNLDQPWVLYQRLREINPAPFGAYVRLGGCTILSSSPERFMSWSRSGAFQMRPIKGTVKKSKHMTYELARSILSCSKERAENLMIVDLIRHDISGIIGAQNCKVSQLMQVEEYETVYQLVSVIEGTLPRVTVERPAANEAKGNTYVNGINVLRAVLPPGSMTGAPKKRSCELLTRFEEHKPRGIYSGVLGYLDVRGGGDFSVVIRTASRVDDEVVWKRKTHIHKTGETTPYCEAITEPRSTEHHAGVGDEQKPLPHQVWRIGAGGAVTVQSTDTGEFQEMETKLEAIIRIFRE